MDLVREYVRPEMTVAVVGSSGVGKSSLVNALAGEEWMATGEIQEWSGKGRHTTTSRELVMLPCGAMALDTPGLRELGIFGVDGFELKGRLGGTHRFRAKS
jgi:ribosome biogenesis GTPase